MGEAGAAFCFAALGLGGELLLPVCCFLLLELSFLVVSFEFLERNESFLRVFEFFYTFLKRKRGATYVFFSQKSSTKQGVF